MPPGRVHPGDERHLAGAFQDNRVIPFEGVRVADMPAEAQRARAGHRRVVRPAAARGPARRPAAGDRARTSTRRGSPGSAAPQPGDVFYYRLQSPVLIAELDHHCGVFLDYDTPQPFHIHTVLRTPHGNDYGRSWVRQWQEVTEAAVHVVSNAGAGADCCESASGSSSSSSRKPASRRTRRVRRLRAC